MGRKPCCEKTGLKKGKWTEEEDEKLINYIKANGIGSWRSLPKNAGLLRCGKSCRLRWMNYLRDDLKRGDFTRDEEETIVGLHKTLGNRTTMIASHLPGRTDNEIKNYWNSQLCRKIYNFRSISEYPLPKDMIKMINTTKKRSSRVGRAVAKKYNNSTNSHSTPPRTTNLNNTSTSIVAEGKASDPLESTSLDGSLSSSSSLFMEVEGKEFEDIFMHFKNILEIDGVENEGENIMSNYGDNEMIMHIESDTTSEKWDCGDCRINSENESTNVCSSPIVSYFNDEAFHWDIDGDGEDLTNLWTQEEEDMIVWPSQSNETSKVA
ncbi:hypothetical protein BUALT_Bualt14G0121900 [Buddleja alternifolia]|uniref:Uncharacterized protein n=1 Tax=Buddleja alternifolia TaxID=168488 RepID=A0AAV6WSE0_9LAMI|nr:hypothetical protein BUALT_Bualt14G0121900 [Buddleja alternifolia]